MLALNALVSLDEPKPLRAGEDYSGGLAFSVSRLLPDFVSNFREFERMILSQERWVLIAAR